MRVLWVDDQTDVARMFASVLQLNGADISFAADGEAGLLLIKDDNFDVVLADLAMPPGRWGGLWLLEQLKSLDNPPPVIVVSGEGAQSETIQAIRLGAADYVTKEKIEEELPDQIQRLLTAQSAPLPYLKLIASGESQTLEFKSTLRTNLHTKKADPIIELAVIKTIAAFLNSGGGTLLVGVNDEGDLLGTALDSFTNSDKFQLHFWNLIRDSIGNEFLEFVTAKLVTVKEVSIFSVSCKPSKRPVFVRWKFPGDSRHQELFFVRAGPQTEQLGTRQAVSYISDHFVGSNISSPFDVTKSKSNT